MFFKVSSPVLCHFGAWHNSVLSTWPGSDVLASENGASKNGVLVRQNKVPAVQISVLASQNDVVNSQERVLASQKGFRQASMP